MKFNFRAMFKAAESRFRVLYAWEEWFDGSTGEETTSDLHVAAAFDGDLLARATYELGGEDHRSLTCAVYSDDTGPAAWVTVDDCTDGTTISHRVHGFHDLQDAIKVASSQDSENHRIAALVAIPALCLRDLT